MITTMLGMGQRPIEEEAVEGEWKSGQCGMCRRPLEEQASKVQS